MFVVCFLAEQRELPGFKQRFQYKTAWLAPIPLQIPSLKRIVNDRTQGQSKLEPFRNRGYNEWSSIKDASAADICL